MAAAPAAGAPGMSGDAALAAKSRRQTSREASARCWLCWTGPPSAVSTTRASTFFALWHAHERKKDEGSEIPGGVLGRAGQGQGGSRAGQGPERDPRAALHRAQHRAKGLALASHHLSVCGSITDGGGSPKRRVNGVSQDEGVGGASGRDKGRQ